MWCIWKTINKIAKKFVAELSEINKSKELKLKKRIRFRSFITVSSVIVLLILIRIIPIINKKQRAIKILDQSIIEFNNQKYDSAADLLKKAYELDPEGIKSWLIKDGTTMMRHYNLDIP